MIFKQCKSFFSFRSINTDCNSFYDVIIVGGGLVGNAMAVALGSLPKLSFFKILVLESSKTPLLLNVPPATHSVRVSAVNPSSINFFKKLGIWDHLTNYRMSSITDLYVSDSCSQSNIHFQQIDNKSPIAHVIENDAIIGALYEKMKSFKNITIKNECKIESCDLPNDLSENATVTLSNGNVFETSLLIGADGAKSQVRECMETKYTSWNYEQCAIVCSLEILSHVKNTIAYQKFTPLGPIALLPLNQNYSSLVWTTSIENTNRLMLLNEEEFVNELNNYLFTKDTQNSLTNQTLFLMNQILSCLSPCKKSVQTQWTFPQVIKIQKDSYRATFPLSFGHSTNYITTRAALIGDAAHKIHPLAGQGVNLGWYDVNCLTDCLQNCIYEGGDIGSTTYLKDYENESQKHNVPIMFATDLLNKLYSTNFPLFVFLRSFGLNTLNNLLPLKDLIINKSS